MRIFNTRTSGTFVAACAAVVGVKLWITSYIRTLPLYAPHDSTNFLDHAQALLSNTWFGSYGPLTLIKGPFLPLYLAAVSELGLSQNLAHQVTYLFACFAACAAIAPLIHSRLVLLAAGLILCFNPMTYDYMSWVTYRSQVSGTLSLLTVACMAAIYIRRDESVRARMPWSVGLGFSLAALWLTREETIWIIPCVYALAAVSVGHARKKQLRIRGQGALVVVPCSVWVAAILFIRLMNWHSYGWAATTELQSSEYISAYDSLQRISRASTEPTVPVPRSARLLAYDVSPLARQLEPYIDGKQSERGWFDASCQSGYSCTDIAGGWFSWALRGAVAAAGHYDSGAHARLFYLGMAREINSACDRHEIACDPKRGSLAPRLSGQIGNVVRHFVSGAKIFASLAAYSVEAWRIGESPPATIKEYAYVTRDVEEIGGQTHAYDWDLKHAVLLTIARAYQVLLPVTLVVVAFAGLIRLARAVLKRAPLSDGYVIAFAVFPSGIALLAILAIIDALSFSGFNDEYFASLYSVVFFALALVCAQEFTALVERVRRFVRPMPG